MPLQTTKPAAWRNLSPPARRSTVYAPQSILDNRAASARQSLQTESSAIGIRFELSHLTFCSPTIKCLTSCYYAAMIKLYGKLVQPVSATLYLMNFIPTTAHKAPMSQCCFVGLALP